MMSVWCVASMGKKRYECREKEDKCLVVRRRVENESCEDTAREERLVVVANC
jgi:hypothetical protein